MKMLTIDDIAERLGVHRTTVWLWYKNGRLTAVARKGPGQTSKLLFDEQTVSEFCQQNGMVWTVEKDA